LDIIGAGSDEIRLRAIGAQLGLGAKITWHGYTPHNRALEIISRGDCFIFTSLQEASSTVVPEALGLGLPMICHDCCGHGALIDESCGIKVPVRDPAASVAGFAEAINSIARHPERIERLSKGALTRARQFSWDENARRMVSIYAAAAGHRTVPQLIENCTATGHPDLLFGGPGSPL
jgi:glycosyltransferase involved in cell wall biosynthesis